MTLAALDVRPSNDAAHPNDPAAIRRVPSSTDAEQAVLGAILYQNDAFHLIDGLEARHFYEPFHERLYEAIEAAIRKGQLAEPILLAELFARDPAFGELGGVVYLAELVDRAPPAANAPQYARHVIDLALRRDLLKLAGDLDVAATEAVQAEDAIEFAARQLSEIELGTGGDHWIAAAPALREAIERAKARTGRIDYPTGIAALDAFTGGLHAGEVTLGAARPGMGKSVAGLTTARANAELGLGVCVFSLDMTRDALMLRLACDLSYDRSAPVFSGIPSSPTFDRAMKGQLDGAEWRLLDEAAARIEGWNLEVDDRSGLTMPQIEAAARRKHREWARRGLKPGPVIIDHLGKVRPTKNRAGSKHAEVADVSADCQEMAKRLQVPVLALVQLSRAVESREDKRPTLSDLRQAGELEEDARQVIFIYRPEYYVREGKPDETFEERTERLDKLQACRNQLFWLVEKNSHGPRGQVQSFCEIACSAIREW